MGCRCEFIRTNKGLCAYKSAPTESMQCPELTGYSSSTAVFSHLSVKSLQFVTRMYRKSNTGAAFQVRLKQINVASVGWAPPTMSGKARPTFGSGSSGLG